MGKEISYKEIARLTLSDDHYSQREIATAANCSPGTVSNVQRRLEAAKIDAATAADLTERELRGLLNSEKGRREGVEYKQPDWARIADEMARDRKLKLIVLWEEYAEEAVLEGKRPYMYSFFSELFRRWVNFNIPTLTRSHVPGDKMEVDWAGDTMELVDPFTGVVSKVYAAGRMPELRITRCSPLNSKTEVAFITELGARCGRSSCELRVSCPFKTAVATFSN